MTNGIFLNPLNNYLKYKRKCLIKKYFVVIILKVRLDEKLEKSFRTLCVGLQLV